MVLDHNQTHVFAWLSMGVKIVMLVDNHLGLVIQAQPWMDNLLVALSFMEMEPYYV